ncbi:hypothetical protein Neosp_003504 [[Neocosmospora] mangrovei]
MNVSYCSSIKKGTVAVSGSSSTIDETTFKTADLNIVVTVKVTNQTTVIKENAEFQRIEGIEPGTTLFNESYGDSSRVESTVKAIKSGLDAKDKVAEGLTLNTYGSDYSTKLSTALKNTESHVSVAWMGGGQVKDENTLWDVSSVFAAAAAFPKRVSECPQRTWAILTKYKSNRSFVKWAHNKMSKVLEYDQVSSYTAELFDSYMDYKMLLKDLQNIIDNRDGFEPRMGVKDALDTSMETLLSVRSALREEQSKIITAINALSRDPSILQRQGSWAALNRSEKVTAIIQRALGKLAGSEATEVAAHVASASDSDGVVDLDDEEPVSKKEFNFATLLPAEVWRDVMPVAKPNYAPITTAPSLGMQAQLGLSGFIPAAPSDDENWVSSKIQVTQIYEDMKKELEKQRAEVDKLRAECDAKIAEVMSKTQQAEASRDSLNQTLTSQLKTKERQASESENRRVVIEQELSNVRGQLQTRTAERDDNARDRDTIKMKLESTTNDLNVAKGQLIPNERDDLHIFHIQWGQTLPVMLGSVINKCYTYHSQKRAIPVTVEFFNNEDSLRGTSKLAVFVYRRNKSGPIKVKGAMEGSTVVFD